MADQEMSLRLCACIGPIGNDPYCPCKMHGIGLTPTNILSPAARVELEEALKKIAKREAERLRLLATIRPITDEEIDKIVERMPNGWDGFLKEWGWRQFARAIEKAHGINK